MPPGDGGPLPQPVASRSPTNLPAGTYVLQIVATSDDPKHAKKARGAVERLSFRRQVLARIVTMNPTLADRMATRIG